MIASYKVLSAVLSYPTAELQAAADEMIEALSLEHLLSPDDCAAVGTLIRTIAEGDLLDVQSQYVDLFDRTRALSLHLFEHVHGESRDRGQAMVSLLERYRESGIDIQANELPDYIPLFLEFLSLQTPDEARAMLSEPSHILAALSERLLARGSSYAVVFQTLVTLSQSKPDMEILSGLRETEIEDPNDLVALDQMWEETEVRFGPGDAQDDNCPRASDLLRQMEAQPVVKAQPETGERL
ncbi:MAG: nitrate reductase molybdenum cofactor assembly chaperone [Alphaproteobacteria bacterium HGW-Alphaproteobacteria-12]|nr:MAG: nitrate reductase molybdenum cofactor assembly chaperone [Alphaproteobacteria bacterium HGW-Alphaproteobacteria-12]|tara:strand:- start:2693 stop:3412 length:720 start_codon:yes stop_codon:yes gene_type:complete